MQDIIGLTYVAATEMERCTAAGAEAVVCPALGPLDGLAPKSHEASNLITEANLRTVFTAMVETDCKLKDCRFHRSRKCRPSYLVEFIVGRMATRISGGY